MVRLAKCQKEPQVTLLMIVADYASVYARSSSSTSPAENSVSIGSVLAYHHFSLVLLVLQMANRSVFPLFLIFIFFPKLSDFCTGKLSPNSRRYTLRYDQMIPLISDAFISPVDVNVSPVPESR